jgi:hypothetical protein
MAAGHRMLSAEAFQTIVDSVRSSEDELETRQFPRVGFSGRAVVVPLSRGTRTPVVMMLRDLSPRSIGIIDRQAMSPGDQFMLCLKAQGRGGNRGVVCTVVRCIPINKHLFSIGATFGGQRACHIDDAQLAGIFARDDRERRQIVG